MKDKSEDIGPSLFKSLHFLPIWNYEMCQSKNDLRYIIKMDDYSDLDKYQESIAMQEAWVKMADEHIDHFGIPKKFERVLKLQTKIALHWYDMAVNDKPHVETFIGVKERQLESLTRKPDSDKSLKFEEQVAILSKYFGYFIDTHKMSVVQYKGLEIRYNEEVRSATIKNMTKTRVNGTK